jgi:hypothetical protein
MTDCVKSSAEETAAALRSARASAQVEESVRI